MGYGYRRRNYGYGRGRSRSSGYSKGVRVGMAKAFRKMGMRPKKQYGRRRYRRRYY